MKSKTVIILALLAILSAGGGFAWWWTHHSANTGDLVLYGNVDLRQAELAFNNSDRIAAVLVEEGDHVSAGQLLAQLDTNRLQPQFEQAQAMADAQHQAVDRLRNGNRPEEIAQAKANLDSAKADAVNAHQQFDRLKDLVKTSDNRAVSQQDLDNAQAAQNVADAKVAMSQKVYELQTLGPRKEDIAQAEAQLRADEAQVALLHQQLNDAKLIAPQAGVIRSRLMEAGEMATPQKPVFSVALIEKKWIRAYVSEPDLGKIHPGMSASVTVDSFPDHPFTGQVGFISPQAEFTPKPVQTEELRTSLVYEVRIFVNDPSDVLRLGMPATVHISAAAATTQPQ